MNVFFWTLQLLFGLFFFVHGILLVAKPAKAREQLDKLPFSGGFLSFIGICESLGGLGLILPMASTIAPWLTPLAAVGLAIIMAGAVWIHVRAAEMKQTVVTVVITVLLVVIFLGRWSLFA